ncbi:MAG: PilZ domain-containing protein [Nitrospirae bacterium]|nr:PilZ domain-containing protein [Nitrospirota bacterium]
MEEKPSDSSVSGKDKRSYHRIGTETPALYRVETETPALYRKAGQNRPPHKKVSSLFPALPHLPLPEGIERGSRYDDRANAQIIELFLWLDWRINSLIKMMSRAEDEQAFPRRSLIVNISASGLKFYSDELLPLSAILEFQLILPVVPFKELLIAGEVAWINPLSDREEGDYVYEVGVEFKDMAEGDREHIIKYVVSRQLRLKREHKS